MPTKYRRVVSTQAGEIEYIDQGKGLPILFVHGTPGGADQGALMSEFLVKSGFRVVAPSRPGYLNTPLTKNNQTPMEQAALHVALMDELGIGEFPIVFWSGGGPSSYTLASQHPERITKLVAIAGASKAYKFKLVGLAEEEMLFGMFGGWLVKEMTTHAQKTILKSLVNEEGKLKPKEAKALVSTIWESPSKRDFALRLMGTVSGKRRAGFNNDRKQLSAITDLGLKKIKQPVLLIHAKTDIDVPYEYSTFAKSQLSNCELITIQRGTHISVWTDPESAVYQSKIIKFLKEEN